MARAQRTCEALMAAWELPHRDRAHAERQRAPQSELEARLAEGTRHIKSCFCTEDTQELFEVLYVELGRVARTAAGPTGKIGLGPWSWSGGVGDTMEPMWKHSGAQEHVEDLKSLGFPTLSWVLSRLAEVFGARVEFWWVNLYSTGDVCCNFHSDSNPRDTITAQASFGATRTLTMRHILSGQEFPFRQENGDVFAFDERVDRDFHHGLHRAGAHVGPRISVLIIGRTHAGVHGFTLRGPRRDVPEDLLLGTAERQLEVLNKLRRLLGANDLEGPQSGAPPDLRELVSTQQAEIERLRTRLQHENPLFRWSA